MSWIEHKWNQVRTTSLSSSNTYVRTPRFPSSSTNGRIYQWYDSNLDRVLMRLDELKGYDEPPTRSASERAKRFVLELAYGLFAGIPSPLVTVAIGQGIDFVWRNGNRHVHVHIPQELSEPIYLYYDDGEEFGTDKNCTAEQVERRVHQYIVN